MSASVLQVPAAPNVSFFTPRQAFPAGTALVPQPNGNSVPKLFQPIKIRDLELQNRIFVASLAQYSSKEGLVTPWHMAHLGGIISRGPGLTLTEATAVSAEGRTSPQDAGIWNDEQTKAWKQVVEFTHSQSQKIGIQLVHGGRKSSMAALWNGSHVVPEEFGGWPNNVWGPSAISQGENHPVPKELTIEGIKNIVAAFANAAKRAVEAGFDTIELHAAHGFLLHQFLSPLSNKRTDSYGGSFENRIRISVEVIDAIRAVIPEGMPLLYRVSATDRVEKTLPNEASWRIEETINLAHVIADHGVDFIDVSSSGLHPAQNFDGFDQPAPQAYLAEAIKRSVGEKLLVGAVGGINNGQLAQSVLDKGQADVILAGRWFQKNPSLVWTFAEELGVSIYLALEMEWPFYGRGNNRGRNLA